MADVQIIVETFNTPTSAGTLNIRPAALAGITPKAAMILGNHHDPANDPSGTPHAQMCYGLFDDTTNMYMWTFSENNVASTDDLRRYDDNLALVAQDPTGAGVSAIFSASSATLVSGGADLVFTAVDTVAHPLVIVFFAGADVDAHVGYVDLGTGTSAIDVTAPGFEPDVVIVMGDSDDQALAGFFSFLIGAVINDGSNTQASFTQGETDAQTAGKPGEYITGTYGGSQIHSTYGTIYYNLTFSDFDANGFSVTPSSTAGSDHIMYLALKLGGNQFDLQSFTTPTTTGEQTYDPGFEPGFYLAAISNRTAMEQSALGADSEGAAICVGTANKQAAVVTSIEYAADPTNTESDFKTNALQCAVNSDMDAIVASLTSFSSSGATFNYSAVDTTARAGFLLMIESSSGSTGGYTSGTRRAVINM